MSVERCIHSACIMECMAPKPGNVTPDQSFDDLTCADFLRSAPITAKWISQSSTLGVGRAVELAAEELAARVGQNTHLGILLLLAPLTAAGDRTDVGRVLQSLSIDDAQAVYRAIRTLQPGGMGQVTDQDVHRVPTATLTECMRLAADRDTIAKQYRDAFADVFQFTDQLNADEFRHSWSAAVVRLHLQILTTQPDSLIARKCGMAVAREASRRAGEILENGCRPDQLAGFDSWLRADGHRRNPGTTADFVTAVLYLGLREQRIAAVPLRIA